MPFKILANPDNIRRFEVKLYPTEQQKVFLDRQIDLFRHVYNWALGKQIESRDKGEGFIKEGDMKKMFISYRAENEWLQELPMNTGREAIANVFNAYKLFFDKRSRFPKFKSRKKAKKSFTVRNDWFAFYFRDDYVKISGLPKKEKILCKSHHIPKEGVRYYKPTIYFDGYDYWLSVAVEVDRDYLLDHEKSDEVIGIDLGIKTTAQLSNGIKYNLPDLHVLEKRRRRLKGKLDKAAHRRATRSRQAKNKLEGESFYTKNELKIKEKFFKTSRRMTNIRHSFVHKMTTEIANMYPKKIVMEDLNVQGMLKDPVVGRLHVGSQFYFIRTQMKYKCRERGIEFVLAHRQFPSSQLCSCCGNKQKIKAARVYRCPVCGLEIDRDLNAAINLSNYTGFNS